jgi:hypothetical protein
MCKSIKDSFSGLKYQKTKTVTEREIQVYLEEEVDCMLEIANNRAVRAIQKEYETNKEFNVISILKYLK